MSVMKQRIFDGYGYPVGTYNINSTVVDKVKEGRYCKLNTDGEITLADKGKKGYLVVFPNRLPKKGFATCKGAFLVGTYSCYIDEDTFDNTQTYKPGELLYIGDEGKLTNQGETGAVAVATVGETDMISEEGKACIGIFSIEKCLCKPAAGGSTGQDDQDHKGQDGN